jgi:hypothetical protein
MRGAEYGGEVRERKRLNKLLISYNSYSLSEEKI